ncbi:MAG: hypothetical protein ABIJ16_12845 [Bacteroidota bacterium]
MKTFIFSFVIVTSVLLIISQSVFCQILLPWQEDFENAGPTTTITTGTASVNGIPSWSYSETNYGRVRFQAGASYYHSGTHAATLDCWSYNAATSVNNLILTLNMSNYSGANDVSLMFYYMQHGEEQHTGDKVFVRGSNTSAWIELYDLWANMAAAGTWKEVTGLDIDAVLYANGQNFTSTFQISFGQQDDYPSANITSSDGITFDDICLYDQRRVWTGKISHETEEADNWLPPFTPGPASDVTIPASATNMPIMDDYFEYLDCRNLGIANGASFELKTHNTFAIKLTVNGNLTNNGTLKCNSAYSNKTIEVYGNWVNNNTFIAGDGTVKLCGSTKTVISGLQTTTFNTLMINKSINDYDGLQLTSTGLTLNAKTIIINSGSLEINPFSVINVGSLTIMDNAGLNLNDGDITLNVSGSLMNRNDICGLGYGFLSSNTNQINFVPVSGDYYIRCGMTSPAGTQLYKVNFNAFGTASWEIIGDMEIQTKLDLTNGIIHTGTYVVIMKSTLTSSIGNYSASSWIDGNLRRYVLPGSYIFPVGTSSNPEQAQINLSSVSGGLNQLTVKFTADNTQVPPAGLEVNSMEIDEFLNYGYWNVTPNTGSANYNISLTSRGHTNGGVSPTQHAVFKRSGAGPWENIGAHDNATQSGTGTNPITAQRSGLSGFSDFIIGRSYDFPLPVNLVSFDAECMGEGVEITWETASQINNDYFTLERSSDGYNYQAIAVTDGCGSCNNLLSYSFTDNPAGGYLYYRLKQTDFDGKFTTTLPIAVSCGIETFNEPYAFYRNGICYASAPGISGQSVTISIYDAGGKIIASSRQENAGNSLLEIPAGNISTGIYFIYVSDGISGIKIKAGFTIN